jgi:hypothetical protein
MRLVGERGSIAAGLGRDRRERGRRRAGGVCEGGPRPKDEFWYCIDWRELPCGVMRPRCEFANFIGQDARRQDEDSQFDLAW